MKININELLANMSKDEDELLRQLDVLRQMGMGGAPLTVGEMFYNVVIVPGCETLSSTTVERLEAFHAAGGQLVFMGNAPSLMEAIPSSRGAELYAAAALRSSGSRTACGGG